MKTEVAPGVEIDSDEIMQETRRGFNPRERMQGRALRTDKITLFTDEEMGPVLGEARDIYTPNGQFAGRAREGILGEIDALEAAKQASIDSQREVTIREAGLKWMEDNPLGGMFDPDTVEHPEYKTLEIDKQIKALEKKRDALIKELEKTALTFSLRAVPPVIAKDCRRLAKKSMKVRERNAGNPEADNFDAEWAEFDQEDKDEWFANAQTAHLLTKMIVSATDHESGGVNTVTSFEDAMDYIDYLPPSQFARLDVVLGKLQIRDAISRSIESQEDFS